MRLIVLGAGVGNRLLPLTAFRPKPLLCLPDGSTILGTLLNSFMEADYGDSATIVGGHQMEKLDSFIMQRKTGIPIDTIFNPAYDIGGPLCSLWMVDELLAEGDFTILNGDTIITPSGLLPLINVSRNGDGIFLAVSNIAGRPDDMLVSQDSSGSILAVGKDLAQEYSDAVSVGLLAVRGQENRKAIRHSLRSLLQESHEARRSWPWHSLLNLAIAEGTRISSVEIPMGTWAEIDSVPDISRASQLDW